MKAIQEERDRIYRQMAWAAAKQVVKVTAQATLLTTRKAMEIGGGLFLYGMSIALSKSWDLTKRAAAWTIKSSWQGLSRCITQRKKEKADELPKTMCGLKITYYPEDSFV